MYGSCLCILVGDIRTGIAASITQQNFRKLWMGSAISFLGDQFYLVALPWVVLQRTGSAVAMGPILMAAAIPRAVLLTVTVFGALHRQVREIQ